ncbi:MAG: 4-hydroxy-tetrahydrodipicolinate synthase [Propionibacteriaceae bacterium]|nr:4-hydroxy-tetrahydrodipicolinate synthase [Propionibacteriaceae bacterium]
MREPVFRGAATALVTPFTPTGEVDIEKLGELLEFQITEGIDAVVILGTTGEASTILTEDHVSTIKAAVDFVQGRIPVIAGAGSNSTVEAIHLTRACEEVGADAILSVTPYYNKTSQRGLVTHFTAIAEVTSLPIILYNVPSRTNLNIDPDTTGELSRIENIVAVKECHTEQMGAVQAATEPDFHLYTGEDAQIIPLLGWGGIGAISVMSNVIPADVHTLVTSWLAGDHDTARQIQLKTLPLVKALFSEVNPIPVKEALNILGFNVGEPKLPLVPASDNTRELLTAALKQYGVPSRP